MRFSLLLDWLERAVLVTVVALCFQGKGSHALFVGIALLIPILRLAFSSPYRQRWQNIVKSRWQEAIVFSECGKTADIPYQAAALFAVLPMLVLSLANGRNIPSMDNYPTNLTAAALVLHGSTELSSLLPDGQARKMCRDELPLEYYFRCRGPGLYSAYPLGMVAFALPVTALSWVIGGRVGDGYTQWRLAKWTGALIAATCAGLFFVVALWLSSAGTALVATVLLQTGSPLLSIVGQGLWSQAGVLFSILAVLFLELLFAKRHPWTSALLEGGLIALMLSCRLTGATFLLPFGLWVLFRNRRRAFVMGVTALVVLGPLGLYYEKMYESPLGPQWKMAPLGKSPTPMKALFGTLFSHACGLFVYQPWVLLFFFSRRFRVGTRGRGEGIGYVFVVAIALQIAIVSNWVGWWGAAWGSRYLTEIVPLMAFGILLPLDALLHLKVGRRLIAVLGALSFLLHAVGVYGPAKNWFYYKPKHSEDVLVEQERMLDWSDPAFLYPFLHQNDK